MFGMLDYRAHKLLWLLMLPMYIIGLLMRFGSIVGGILIAQMIGYHPTIKILIAYATYEALTIIALVLLAPVNWVVKRVFFWVIDVLPAHGTDQEEAREIVLQGRAFELSLKMGKDIANWTLDDTDGFIACLNWRARMFFGSAIRARMQSTVLALQHILNETGRQPAQCDVAKVRKETCGNVPWFENAVVSQPYFNSLTAIVIIVLVIAASH